jgi:hypothetical protein
MIHFVKTPLFADVWKDIMNKIKKDVENAISDAANALINHIVQSALVLLFVNLLLIVNVKRVILRFQRSPYAKNVSINVKPVPI